MKNFEEKISYNQISFRYAKGRSLRSGNEIHPYHEILYYIDDGGATFLSADFKETLKPGTLVIIPKELYHNLHIENQNAYRRFVINFPDLDILHGILPLFMSQIRIIRNVNADIRHILNRMCEVLYSKPDRDVSLFLYGSFLALLSEISFDLTNATAPIMRQREQLITRCLDYIELHYSSAIKVEDIAKAMYVSVSALFLCFKREMGIPLHKYITEKRMVKAKRLIEQGEKPTAIYKECGFTDYSAFYKAYKKMFLTSPSADRQK